MRREQKTAKSGCCCEGMLETESNSGVQSVATLETAEKDGAENLLEQILHMPTTATYTSKASERPNP